MVLRRLRQTTRPDFALYVIENVLSTDIPTLPSACIILGREPYQSF